MYRFGASWRRLSDYDTLKLLKAKAKRLTNNVQTANLSRRRSRVRAASFVFQFFPAFSPVRKDARGMRLSHAALPPLGGHLGGPIPGALVGAFV